jgi:hypothetical protein
MKNNIFLTLFLALALPAWAQVGPSTNAQFNADGSLQLGHSVSGAMNAAIGGNFWVYGDVYGQSNTFLSSLTVTNATNAATGLPLADTSITNGLMGTNIATGTVWSNLIATVSAAVGAGSGYVTSAVTNGMNLVLNTMQFGSVNLTNWSALSTNLMVRTNLLTTKGDMAVFDGTNWNRIVAGADGTYLMASNATATGVAYVTPATGGGSGIATLNGVGTNTYLTNGTSSGENATNLTLTGAATIASGATLNGQALAYLTNLLYHAASVPTVVTNAGQGTTNATVGIVNTGAQNDLDFGVWLVNGGPTIITVGTPVYTVTFGHAFASTPNSITWVATGPIANAIRLSNAQVTVTNLSTTGFTLTFGVSAGQINANSYTNWFHVGP